MSDPTGTSSPPVPHSTPPAPQPIDPTVTTNRSPLGTLLSVSPAPGPIDESTTCPSIPIQLPDSTPVQHNLQTHQDFSQSSPPLSGLLYQKLDQEMRQAFVGPLPVRNFLDDFLPTENFPSAPESLGFEKLAKVTSESQMYRLFVDAVNQILKKLIAFDTSKKLAGELEARYKPDVTIYETGSQDPQHPLTSFQTMEMFVEFKHGVDSDPFGTREQFLRPSQDACSVRGQVTLYSARQQAYQFRSSILSVGIFGRVARLFRWDRTGATVSEPIDYSKPEGNQRLVEFFTRFDLMSREGRGWDSTAEDASKTESADFDKAIERASNEQLKHGKKDPRFSKLAESIGRNDQYPRKKLAVLDGETAKSYIVGRPISVIKSPTGRGARGFVGMSVETKELVFLKDSWRPDVEGIKPEGDWYQKFRKEQTEHIGAFLHGSDICGTKGLVRCLDKKQRTVTNLYSEELAGFDKMVGYIHYRTVQPELYFPLESFKSSQHLTSVMRDIALAIKQVHSAGVFHRDLSPRNIMIDVQGHGRLIDFDLARDREETGARQAIRTGTWQFMSTEQLTNPGKKYEVSDDLESFFFVIFYEGVCWVEHKGLELSLENVFNHVEFTGGQHKGGQGKRDLYNEKKAQMTQNLKFTKSEPFTDLIRQLYLLFRSLRIVIRNEAYMTPEDTDNAKKLEDCEGVVQLMEDAVKRDDWPRESDKVEKRKYTLKDEGDDAIGLSYLNFVPGTKRGLKEALGDSDTDTQTKHARVD